MTLPEFLLARFAEDEAQARDMWEDDFPNGPEIGTWFHWVLAECEAKRQIVERFAADYPHPDEGCGCYESPDGHHAQVDGANTLLDLATVYADHPDYRQEWKP